MAPTLLPGAAGGHPSATAQDRSLLEEIRGAPCCVPIQLIRGQPGWDGYATLPVTRSLEAPYYMSASRPPDLHCLDKHSIFGLKRQQLEDR
ncbi:hypothetical protein HMPREF9069_00540, partial [Atopobium sp. oral taxon 810 str. F0209]